MGCLHFFTSLIHSTFPLTEQTSSESSSTEGFENHSHYPGVAYKNARHIAGSFWTFQKSLKCSYPRTTGNGVENRVRGPVQK